MLQDYGSIIRSGMNLVPDMAQQLLQKRLASLQERQVGLGERQFDMKAQAQSDALDRRAQFEQALNEAGSDPQSIARLMAQFPEYSEDLKRSFDAMDEDQRNADVRVMAGAYQSARGGNISAALDILKERQKAEIAAGEDDPQMRRLIGMLESPDTRQHETAMALIGTTLAAATGDKFASTYGEIFKDDRKGSLQVDAEYLRSIGRDDLADQLLVNKVDPLVQINGPAGTNVIPRSQALGGTPSAPTGGGDPSGSSVVDYQAFIGTRSTLGQAAADDFARKYVIRVNTPQEAAMLPVGTKIVLPDGTQRVVK